VHLGMHRCKWWSCPAVYAGGLLSVCQGTLMLTMTTTSVLLFDNVWSEVLKSAAK
jgi:hypothetical protein